MMPDGAISWQSYIQPSTTGSAEGLFRHRNGCPSPVPCCLYAHEPWPCWQLLGDSASGPVTPLYCSEQPAPSTQAGVCPTAQAAAPPGTWNWGSSSSLGLTDSTPTVLDQAEEIPIFQKTPKEYNLAASSNVNLPKHIFRQLGSHPVVESTPPALPSHLCEPPCSATAVQPQPWAGFHSSPERSAAASGPPWHSPGGARVLPCAANSPASTLLPLHLALRFRFQCLSPEGIKRSWSLVPRLLRIQGIFAE